MTSATATQVSTALLTPTHTRQLSGAVQRCAHRCVFPPPTRSLFSLPHSMLSLPHLQCARFHNHSSFLSEFPTFLHLIVVCAVLSYGSAGRCLSRDRCRPAACVTLPHVSSFSLQRS